jgi:hypothetical protein
MTEKEAEKEEVLDEHQSAAKNRALKKKAIVLFWRRWNTREENDDKLVEFTHRKLPKFNETDRDWLGGNHPSLRNCNWYDEREILWTSWGGWSPKELQKLSAILCSNRNHLNHVWFDRKGVVFDRPYAITYFRRQFNHWWEIACHVGNRTFTWLEWDQMQRERKTLWNEETYLNGAPTYPSYRRSAKQIVQTFFNNIQLSDLSPIVVAFMF